MSELTQCNYCSLKQIRAQAKARGRVIRLRNGSDGIYVHELNPGDELDLSDWDDGNPQIRSWFMALTNSCVC